MTDKTVCTGPAEPFVPQDLDDLIFRWESDVPPVSNR